MLTIRVAASTAVGVTGLSAFDRALQGLGAHDVNLVTLSSVVPVGAQVVRDTVGTDEFASGDRLYCVVAESRAVVPGSQAWAGLAWAVDVEGRGGIFLEAHGASEHLVRYELDVGMAQMAADRPYWQLGEVDVEVIGIDCAHEPVCALVLAAYSAEPW